jgi:hypothetical protein
LHCLGIFKDEAENRYGFLYQPPKYIEVIAADYKQGGISKLRKPVSLLSLLRTPADLGKSAVVGLGVRFNIIKQLAQSLYFLHAAGWVHVKSKHGLSLAQ